MSDYQNPNLNRADAVSGRGLLITFAVVIGIFLLLATVGSLTSSGGAPVGEQTVNPETAPAAVPVTD